LDGALGASLPHRAHLEDLVGDRDCSAHLHTHALFGVDEILAHESFAKSNWLLSTVAAGLRATEAAVEDAGRFLVFGLLLSWAPWHAEAAFSAERNLSAFYRQLLVHVVSPLQVFKLVCIVDLSKGFQAVGADHKRALSLLKLRS